MGSDDLAMLRATFDLEDPFDFERWTFTLLTFYCGIRKRDVALLRFEDQGDGGDAFMFRVRRTGRTVLIRCTDHPKDDYQFIDLCPNCSLDRYLYMRLVEHWGWDGLVFPNARRRWRPLI